MPTKKSTTRKTTKTVKTTRAKKSAPAKKTTTTKKSAKRTVKTLPNKCATISIVGIIALVICVFIAGGMAIYSAIDNYRAITRISDFTIITEDDVYSTIAMNDDFLEIAASDWGDPATKYQAKVELATGNAQVAIHYEQPANATCDLNSDNSCVYQGKLSEKTLTQIINSAKAILGNNQKTTLGISDYTVNDALIEICKSIIEDFKED